MKELDALIQAVSRLPEEQRRQITPSVISVAYSFGRRQRILNLVKDTISQLRLDMKYLVFDLEATRRENRYLRQMLEARPPRDRERGRDDEGPSSF